MTAPMPGAVVECRGLSAGYRSGAAPVPVVSDATFTLAEGEAVVIVGASGSGKSTLLRALNRFDDPLAGTVLYRGRSVLEMDPLELRRRVSLVLQTVVMFDGTVRDNLQAAPHGTPQLAPGRLEELLSDVGLEASFLDRDADGLSGGEKQRVALARALAREPDVLLLDEPTSALDPDSSATLANLLATLRDRKKVTLLVVTHQPDLAERVGGRTMTLRDGRLEGGTR